MVCSQVLDELRLKLVVFGSYSSECFVAEFTLDYDQHVFGFVIAAFGIDCKDCVSELVEHR